MRHLSLRDPADPGRLRLSRLALLLALIAAVLVVLALPARVNARDRYRTIYRGETLIDIALEYKTTPETLRWLNQMAPEEPVWAGQKLLLPPRKGMVLFEAGRADTPASLATKGGMPVARFVELNKVAPQARLRPGKRYFVEPKEGIFASSEAPVHVVREGDTLKSIAEQYRSSEKEIVAVNKLNSGRALVPGTRLLVPPLSLHTRIANAPEDKYGYPIIKLADFPSLTEKWVEVDLLRQRVVAWEGVRPVRSFVISSGKSATPTVTGVFRIRAKVAAQTMSGGSEEAGDAYHLPNVQWVSYFYGAYSFHGTYWHNNFGHPMSHGCINMRTEEAEWIYKWMGPENPNKSWRDTAANELGTLVIVHK